MRIQLSILCHVNSLDYYAIHTMYECDYERANELVKLQFARYVRFHRHGMRLCREKKHVSFIIYVLALKSIGITLTIKHRSV